MNYFFTSLLRLNRNSVEGGEVYERKEKMEKELKEAIEYSKNHQEVKQETRKVKMPEVTGPKVNIKTYSKEEFEW